VEQEARLAIFEARSHYMPQVYDGRIILFRAADRRAWRDDDPLDGWGDLAAGGVEAYELRGGHATIYREPHVGMLTKTLGDVLHRAQAEMENERPALVEPNASLDGRRSFSHSQTSRKERTNPLQERQIISELLPGK
jgi:hypothetical protein